MRKLIHIDIMNGEEIPPAAYEGGQLFQRVDPIYKQGGQWNGVTGLRYWFIKEVSDASYWCILCRRFFDSYEEWHGHSCRDDSCQ